MTKIDEIINNLEPFVHGLGKAVLRELREELAQPAGEAEPFEIKWPDYSSEGMGCGLEDLGITDRYEAMAYGWQEAIDSCMGAIPEVIYAAPPKAQPLTAEQIDDIAIEHLGNPGIGPERFARAIEAHYKKGGTE